MKGAASNSLAIITRDRGKKEGEKKLLEKLRPPPPKSLNLLYLENGQARLREAVEVAPGLDCVRELPAEDLHSQQGEDEDEQEENDEQGVDGRDRVHQRLDEVSHGRPVPKSHAREGDD